MDGTQIQAWASVKSFRPRGEGEAGGDGGGSGAETKGEGATAEAESGAAGTDGGATGRNRERDFHGERWSNETHASTTDGDAQLYRKGKESRLCDLGHAMMENRNGLVVDGLLSRATGTAERDAAWVMAARRPERRRRITLGADKAYDTRDFVAEGEAIKVTVHAAQNTKGQHLGRPGRGGSERGLRAQPGGAQADRGDLRLDQIGRRQGPNAVPRPRAGRHELHLPPLGLQPDPPAEAARSTATVRQTTLGVRLKCEITRQVLPSPDHPARKYTVTRRQNARAA